MLRVLRSVAAHEVGSHTLTGQVEAGQLHFRPPSFKILYEKVDDILRGHSLIVKRFRSRACSAAEAVYEDDAEVLCHGEEDLLVHARLAAVAVDPDKVRLACASGRISCRSYYGGSDRELLASVIFAHGNTCPLYALIWQATESIHVPLGSFVVLPRNRLGHFSIDYKYYQNI